MTVPTVEEQRRSAKEWGKREEGKRKERRRKKEGKTIYIYIL